MTNLEKTNDADMRYLLQCLELRTGGIELRSEYPDENERFIWYPDENEVWDKKVDAVYGPVELCMVVKKCKREQALNWIKNMGLV